MMSSRVNRKWWSEPLLQSSELGQSYIELHLLVIDFLKLLVSLEDKEHTKVLNMEQV